MKLSSKVFASAATAVLATALTPMTVYAADNPNQFTGDLPLFIGVPDNGGGNGGGQGGYNPGGGNGGQGGYHPGGGNGGGSANQPQASTQKVYVYLHVTGDTSGLKLNGHEWYTIGKVSVDGLVSPDQYYVAHPGDYSSYNKEYDSVIQKAISTSIIRFGANESLDITDATWKGLKISDGADDYVGSGSWAYHYDGEINAAALANYTVSWVDEESNPLAASETGVAAVDSKVTGEQKSFDGYTFVRVEPSATIEIAKDGANEIRFVYAKDNTGETPGDQPQQPGGGDQPGCETGDGGSTEEGDGQGDNGDGSSSEEGGSTGGDNGDGGSSEIPGDQPQQPGDNGGDGGNTNPGDNGGSQGANGDGGSTEIPGDQPQQPGEPTTPTDPDTDVPASDDGDEGNIDNPDDDVDVVDEADDPAANANDENVASGSDGKDVSPKTGDTSVPVGPLAVLAGLLGVITTRFRKIFA